ncbi:hypothetical protein PC116_g20644 [Phytophthora cactorum]|uniref:Uncharacterized protein n=1 Tax=Phytophthora cactorum TaxID=29920 RepID=A0A8T1B604_9STRA|nr:hypothetical protein PC112_g16835 [Phytophthora cactorum]KAG2810331.1 hypothetical protein PC111_g15704 [Phytophthora cactorum]KAG2860631.1 hypothetical protein PC113_g7874 [Phytophthora cactorum]KAG2883305.1 hypothetical protein PC114_g20657 [Phytophthora cactorum]KAG2893728.1 hypothetical protein PC115_g18364 [Phytophthora cactorum]
MKLARRFANTFNAASNKHIWEGWRTSLYQQHGTLPALVSNARTALPQNQLHPCNKSGAATCRACHHRLAASQTAVIANVYPTMT